MQAIVLCGGKGERLSPLTLSQPKPLIPIRGRAIVDYVVDLLRKHGVSDLIVATGCKSEQFYDHFAEDSSVRVVDSGDVDIIERLRLCARYVREDFFVLYGDTVSDVDLRELASFHQANPHDVTVTAWALRTQFGVMELDPDGTVSSFEEKPQLDKWINIGHFYFGRQAIAGLRGFERFEDYLRELVQAGRLNAYRHTGAHITVNTINELEEAEAQIDRALGVS